MIPALTPTGRTYACCDEHTADLLMWFTVDHETSLIKLRPVADSHYLCHCRAAATYFAAEQRPQESKP